MPRFPQEIAGLKGIVTIIIWYSYLQSFYLRPWESFGYDDDHVSADLQICSIQWDAVLVVICPMGEDTYSSQMSCCCTYTQGGQKWHMLVSIYTNSTIHMSRMSMFYWSHRILRYVFQLLAIHGLVPWPLGLGPTPLFYQQKLSPSSPGLVSVVSWSMVIVGTSPKDGVVGPLPNGSYMPVIRSPLNLTGIPSSK